LETPTPDRFVIFLAKGSGFMPQKELKIQPSRVNEECIRGALYHYDKVTEEDVIALGIRVMPGPRAGMTEREAGVTVRRLKSGRLNVTVESHARILRSAEFRAFMDSLFTPQPLDPYPIYPTPRQAIQAVSEPPMDGISGRWVLDIATRRFGVPISSAKLARALDPSAITEMAEAEFYLGIDEADRVRAAFDEAIAGNATLDVEYRRHGAPVRITGAVLRDMAGAAVRIIGVTAKAATQRAAA
jgi:hypothetical protein